MPWYLSCLSSNAASAEDVKNLQRCKQDMKKCKKVRKLLQRDLKKIRRLHQKHPEAHMHDGGRRGEALEIDLLSEIRATEFKINEFENKIKKLSKKKPKSEEERQKSPSAETFSAPKYGGGDNNVNLQRAKVVQELQMLFAGVNTNPAPENSQRQKKKVKGFKAYYQTFMYM